MKRIAVLGSTGSIGKSSLEVIDHHADRVQLVGVTAHGNWQLLAQQCQKFRPRWAVLSDESLRTAIPRDAFPPETELLFGSHAVERLAAEPDVDVVISGIVGAAGLRGTWVALESGKRVGIANKETFVVAGPLVLSLAERTGATVIPVDSEHSAIFQCLQAGRPEDVKRLVLTASGGPFRGWKAEQLDHVTPQKALAHPTWNMGPKITIDSATMMNKALEVIEARWLFGFEVDRIAVVVHPQSIVHSLVEYIDGSVIAQLSPPDMKLPIQYALSYPERWEGISPRVDWRQGMRLDFQPPDDESFPAPRLGFDVARRGGTCGAVLNAANEVAVERFLSGSLRFREIPAACRDILEAHDFDSAPTLTELFRQDAWAREEMRRWRS